MSTRARCGRDGRDLGSLRSGLALLSACALSMPAALGGGFDRAALSAYVDAQGARDAPRLYAYSGTVYDVPSGRILATVDGYQQARAFGAPAPDDSAFVVRRAFLLYRAVDDGRVLRVYPDVRAARTPPPLSLTRLALSGDRIASVAVSGTRGEARRVTVPEQLDAHREGAHWVFRRVLAPPNPIEQPVEIQEAVVRDAAAPAGERIRWVMTKVANNPDFLPPGGRHLLHLTWRPVERWDELAPIVREFIEREAPGMKTLPATLAAALSELGLPDQGAFDR